MSSNKTTLVLTLTILSLGHFLVDFMIGIWPVYKTIAQLDLALVGLIGGFCALAGEGCQIFFGILSDRGYRKSLIIVGIATTASCILLAYTNHYAVIFLLCLLTCMGSGAFHPSAISVMSELNENRKALIISIFASGGALGLASSQIIFSETYYHLNGQVILLVIPSIVLAVIASLYRQTKSNAVPEKKKINFSIFKKFFQRHDLRWLYISQVCNAALVWGLMFLLPDILNSRHYDPWIVFGTAHFVLILGGAVMMIPVGYISDKISSRSVILYATLIGLVFFYSFLLIPDLSNLAVLILLFLTGASLGVVNPVSVAFGTRLAPEHKASVGAFLMGMVWCVSEMIGQCGGGLLTKLFVEDAPAKSLEVLGGLFLIGVIAALRLPSLSEKLQEKLEYA